MADGQVIPSSNYMYTDGLLTLPSGTGYSLTVPAASISQNPTNGRRYGISRYACHYGKRNHLNLSPEFIQHSEWVESMKRNRI